MTDRLKSWRDSLLGISANQEPKERFKTLMFKNKGKYGRDVYCAVIDGGLHAVPMPVLSMMACKKKHLEEKWPKIDFSHVKLVTITIKRQS